MPRIIGNPVWHDHRTKNQVRRLSAVAKPFQPADYNGVSCVSPLTAAHRSNDQVLELQNRDVPVWHVHSPSGVGHFLCVAV